MRTDRRECPASLVQGNDLLVLDAALALFDFLPGANLVLVRGDPKCPWEDMALMARCRHHVIANSSFSWWGAWLRGDSGGIVVSPKRWCNAAS